MRDEQINAFDKAHVQPLVKAVKDGLAKRGATIKVEHCAIDYVNGEWVRCYITTHSRRGYYPTGDIELRYEGDRRVTQRRKPEKFNAEKIADSLIAAAAKLKAKNESQTAAYEAREKADAERGRIERDAGLPRRSLSGHPAYLTLTLRGLSQETLAAIGKIVATSKGNP